LTTKKTDCYVSKNKQNTWDCMMRIALETLFNFLEGAGSVLDISSSDPILPNEFAGFESGNDPFTPLTRDYNNICQDMFKAWNTVLEYPSAFLPHDDKQKKQ
jgi:hypothetical protein